MSEIDSRDFLVELEQALALGDQIKAKAVLLELKQVDLETRRRAVYELSRAEEAQAVPLLLFLAISFPDFLDAYANMRQVLITQIADHPGEITQIFPHLSLEEKRVFLDCLKDVPGINFSRELTRLLGQSMDVDALNLVLELMGRARGPAVIVALTKQLESPDQDVAQTALTALGAMGSGSAMEALARTIGKNPALDPAIRTLLDKNFAGMSLSGLDVMLRSRHAVLRTRAKTGLEQRADRALPMLLKNLYDDNEDVVIHSLNVLGVIGHTAAVPPIRKLLFKQTASANVRFAAYEALGSLPTDKEPHALAAGLEDPDPSVRMAAAKAVDASYDHRLSKGMKHLVSPGAPGVMANIEIIIDAQTSKLFKDLYDEPFFSRYARSYLLTKAHPDVRRHYIPLLGELQAEDLAAELEASLAMASPAGKVIFCIDDSPVILNFYRGMLTALGYPCEVFEDPAQAVAQLPTQKPAMVFTDLNMPGLTGIEVTLAVRQYDADLPVVLVTTQSESSDHDAARQAGVSQIILKPFTKTQLEELTGRYLT